MASRRARPAAAGRRILLTGASGFVGSRVYPELVARGYLVRCASRRVDDARRRWPERDWVHVDLEDAALTRAALEGCEGVLYLAHAMRQQGNFELREERAARSVAESARAAGCHRIVYLGGIDPGGVLSKHLRSRLSTGLLLRTSGVATLELRASMIIGEGSESWRLTRDLASALPVLLLPPWAEHRTEPVAVNDVVAALLHGLEGDAVGAWDLPGPEALSIREILLRVAAGLGRAPRVLRIPGLSARRAARWMGAFTTADPHLTGWLVEGLASDVLAGARRYWEAMPALRLTGFDDAVADALAQEGVVSRPAKP